jgi:hypothetical protein
VQHALMAACLQCYKAAEDANLTATVALVMGGCVRGATCAGKPRYCGMHRIQVREAHLMGMVALVSGGCALGASGTYHCMQRLFAGGKVVGSLICTGIPVHLSKQACACSGQAE